MSIARRGAVVLVEVGAMLVVLLVGLTALIFGWMPSAREVATDPNAALRALQAGSDWRAFVVFFVAIPTGVMLHRRVEHEVRKLALRAGDSS